MHIVSFTDWLELLGLSDASAGLLAGEATLPETRDRVNDAKTERPSVSQDFVSVLDQLEPFYDAVSEAIAEQTEFIERFNAAVSQFGENFPAPGDRLLNDNDLQQMAEIRRQLLDRISETSLQLQDVADEIQALLDELDGLQSGMDEGDPFAGEDMATAIDDLNALRDQMEDAGCLG